MSVAISWQKMFDYWKSNQFKTKPFCKGATEQEIENFKKELKLNLSNDFIKSLKISNGEASNYLGKINLLDTKRILQTSLYSADDQFPKEWITLTYWDGDYISILDTRKETFGQVLFGIIEEDLFLVWANSYEEWLDMMVEEVINNDYIDEGMLYSIYKYHKYKNKKLKKLKYPNY